MNKLLLAIITADFKRVLKDLVKPQFTVTLQEERSRCNGDAVDGISFSPCQCK